MKVIIDFTTLGCHEPKTRFVPRNLPPIIARHTRTVITKMKSEPKSQSLIDTPNTEYVIQIYLIHEKKCRNTPRIKTAKLTTRSAIRIFLNALINFSATKATVNIATNSLNNRIIHLISSSTVCSDRSSVPSSVRAGSQRLSTVRSSSVCSPKGHRVKLMTLFYQKLQKTFFLLLLSQLKTFIP